MSKYDGWAIKRNDGSISVKSFHRKRTDIVRWWDTAPWHTDSWKNFSRRSGYKIVKVELVEVKESSKRLAVTEKDVFDFHNNLMTITEDSKTQDESVRRELSYIRFWLRSNGLSVVT